MSITYVYGDILDSDARAICHQVNCCGVMGAGLAKQIASRFPEVKRLYQKRCFGKSKPSLLGTVQAIPVSDSQYVLNIFGQVDYGRDRRYTDYEALRTALSTIQEYFRGHRIAIPFKMGCGLAGGDWSTVLDIIKETLTDCRVLIYVKN